MLLEMIIGGGILCYAASKFVRVKLELKPYDVSETIARTKKTTINMVDGVRRCLTRRDEWEKTKARRKAQEVYDSTVARIFENATEEEKEALLALFQKYVPKDE